MYFSSGWSVPWRYAWYVEAHSPINGAHPSGCLMGEVSAPGVLADARTHRLLSGDTFGILESLRYLRETIKQSAGIIYCPSSVDIILSTWLNCFFTQRHKEARSFFINWLNWLYRFSRRPWGLQRFRQKNITLRLGYALPIAFFAPLTSIAGPA